MKIKARGIRRVEIQAQFHVSVLATARAYVVYITKPGQVVAVGPKKEALGKAMTAAEPAIIAGASY